MHGTTREHLFHLLAEASELEHNLLCSYLFALFSLKRQESEGLTTEEHLAVQRWRKVLLSVCVEEMVHLSQVANLTAALGGRPHFNRPNLPVSPGYHPAEIVVGLTPFGVETLKHFVFLERPESAPVVDGDIPAVEDAIARPQPPLRLIPSAPDYTTIGEFYAALRAALTSFCNGRDTSEAFPCQAFQLDGSLIDAPSLRRIASLKDAVEAIDLIVEQGEGAPEAGDDSHFTRFEDMLEELERLQAARAQFQPARNVGANPVMRPPQAEARTYVTAEPARSCLDAFNAVYWMMLRTLTALYDLPASDSRSAKALVRHMLGCMHLMGEVSDALTQHPASDDAADIMAGPSFTVYRHSEGAVGHRQAMLMLRERSAEISARLTELSAAGVMADRCASNARRLSESLAAACAEAGPLRGG